LAQLITMNPYHPEDWLIAQAAEAIRKGAIAVIPTDTIYAIVGSVESREALKRLYRLKGVESNDPKKPLSVLVADLAAISDYTRGIPHYAFRMVRRALPGPYTFILEASKRIPSGALQGRKTIGVRIPDHPVTLAILRAVGVPLLATSVVHVEPENPHDDPVEISTHLGRDLDLVVDVGPIYPEPSTVVDLTGDEPVVLREGKGPIDLL
jgi:tRNA threonylcarbamoyl adenosine modification protein (Sua5/YciO/YrdC/YwlC family)